MSTAASRRPAYDFTDTARKCLALYQQPAGFLLANGRRGANGMPWGPGTFESVEACQAWLDKQHAAGGWHETLVEVAPGVWEVMTDGVLRWWNEGLYGATEAKAALVAALAA